MDKHTGYSILAGLFLVLALMSGRALALAWTDVNPYVLFLANRNEHSGSAVNMGNGYALTANHLYNKKGVFLSNDTWEKAVMDSMKKLQKQGHLKAAEVVKRDKNEDLMLLRDPLIPRLKPVELADVALDDEVLMVSFSLGRKHVHRGRVSYIGPDKFHMDISATFGSSGGGVWDKDGKLVGIFTDLIVSDHLIGPTYGRAVKASVIRKFLVQ